MERLLEIMTRLRQECPWDSKQTHTSLKPYLLEEAYEVLEAIESKDNEAMSKELGDLLLQIVFHSEIAAENNHFDFNNVVQNISTKLIDRHPHVFLDKDLHTAQDVQENWEHTKVKNERRNSILEGTPKTAPALLSAQRLQEKAATVGFEWDTIAPVFEKVLEEFQEFKIEYEQKNFSKMREEFGDILFALVNLGRFLDINAEDALRQTNNKFVKRFQYIEKQFNNDPSAMKQASLEKLDAVWEEAKNLDD